jgi:outer membrane protein TolC
MVTRRALAGLVLLALAAPSTGLTVSAGEIQPPQPVAVPEAPPPPLRLADALARSLANVQVVQADVAVRTATVGRFEALKAFVPLANLPQIFVGFRRLSAPTENFSIIFPDVTGGTPLAGRPRLDHAELSRMNLFLPLDPSGHITALPLAEEGIRAKEILEQLVRRSQAVLAAQRYFEAKQVLYGIVTASRGLDLAEATNDLVARKLREKQAHDVEATQARVDRSKAAVLLAELEKDARVTQRRLGVVLHTSRLLVPQDVGPAPIEPDCVFRFDLDDADCVDLARIPDFPCSREEAVQRAKRQRYEVRLMQVGLRAARLQEQRDRIRLFGLGQLPLSVSFKNTTPGNGGVAFGAIFGTTYDLPLVDIGLWANLKRARLDVVRAQLDLENALIDVVADAGNAWDRWQQAELEWQQREKELRLRKEYFDRERRLLEQKQSIEVDVMAMQVAVLQADANRWTAWYNAQLARLDVLRSTELLLDYIEKAGIATVPGLSDPPPPVARTAWPKRWAALFWPEERQ